jgi:Ca-activated chloride channel homolog
MTFEHPIFLLLLLLLPVVWLRFRVPGRTAQLSLVLKCAAFTALVIALADPWAQMLVRKLAVTVLMDTSASMPRESIQRGQSMLRDLVRHNSGAQLRLITFGGTAKLQELPQQADRVVIPQTVDPNAGMTTDMESALQLALSTFPQQGARRVLVISDGNENRGHVLTEALRARESGVSVSTWPVGGTARMPVQLASISMPSEVFSGEHFTLSLRLNSAKALPARVSIVSQGQEIGAASVNLHAGANDVDVNGQMANAGVNVLETHITGEGAEQILFTQAISVRQPRILYIFGGSGPSQPLLDSLQRAQIDVDRQTDFPSSGKQDWDAVILDDYPLNQLSPDEETALDKYVFSGGGLIFIAGENNAELPEKPDTPVEKLLPVQGQPEFAKGETTALVLVLDKSQSMKGLKIAMTREAARESLKALRPIDKIGVIAFDEVFRWVVPLQSAADTNRITELIDSINADGGTSIYPALQSAIEAIRRERVTRRHIILMTDGLSNPGDFPQLEQDAATRHIPVSTVGVGNDVDRTLLEEIARTTSGKSYFVENPEKIPQIISGEVRDPTVSSIQERDLRVTQVRPVEFTDGIDFDHAPHLLGFVKAKAKDRSETILRVDTGDPLLTRWQYGLGRVVAFMSDAKSRWSANWVKWDSYGTLWPQLVRDVSHRDRTVRVGVRPGNREGEAVVFYDALSQTDNKGEPSLGGTGVPRILASSPSAPSREIALEETAPGHYEARIPADQRGLYRIVSGDAELSLPEAGFYRESEELKPQGINMALLTEVSRITGGIIRPSAEQLLNDKGSFVRESSPLWAYWLVLALLLDLIEVAVRKGFWERLFPRTQSNTSAPHPVVGSWHALVHRLRRA